jgi:hypothetical protein
MATRIYDSVRPGVGLLEQAMLKVMAQSVSPDLFLCKFRRKDLRSILFQVICMS